MRAVGRLFSCYYSYFKIDGIKHGGNYTFASGLTPYNDMTIIHRYMMN